ncbi:hypothetical protein [Gorillibacterium massiliense]|uniref:hypothetical protein n=1 Tax=Gorillibacterium massiliense TaxID=1280390 RepID=UPI000593A043|nr:hypothetical protein [Gorillibacterium massiliense]
MTDNVILESIRLFCELYVSPKIKLRAPTDDNAQYQLRNPNVLIGWLPPNQMENLPLKLPDGLKQAIPAMVIGMDEGEDTGSDAGITIRISFIVHDSGLNPTLDELAPNYEGYRDLLNFIFACRQELSSTYLVAGGETAAQKPFRWGVYQQQPIGYWVGWLTFRATAVVLPYLQKHEQLNFDWSE